MKTLSLTLLALLTITANAGGKIEAKDTKDAFIPADKNSTVNSQDRSLYMPRIITPDSLKSGIYGGLGLSVSAMAADTSISYFSQKRGNNRMIDLAVVAGYNFNKYLATESRVIVSAAYENDVDFKSWGLYLKPQYEVYKDLQLYSLIGFGKVSAKNINDDKLKVSKTTPQVGVGANYKLKNNFKVFADYTYLGKDSKAKYNNAPSVIKSSAVTTGITYDF
jgi:opacity protein-like surface antigen